MKRLKVISAIVIVLIAKSCSFKNDYDPDTYLTIKEKDKILQVIIRYMGKAPENINPTERFETKYNEYYLDIASRHRFDQYYIDSEGTHFFLISRPAPSLLEKRVAIGGRLKLNENNELVEYEEVFRTWKMKEEDLKIKGLFLFKLMVNKEDLSPYYRINSTEEYIEFPDDHNYYDKTDRAWKVK